MRAIPTSAVTVLFAALVGALFLPAVSADPDNPDSNNPGENSTNNPGNEPPDGG